MKFNKKRSISRLKSYIENNFNISPQGDKKIFYNYNELSGIRFWKKAILNLDVKSIITYIKA